MTRDEHVTMIAARLGSRTDLNTEIITMMQRVQALNLEGGAFLPWFLMGTVSLSLSAGQSSVSLPSDFLRPLEDATVRMYPTSDDDDLSELDVLLPDALAAASVDAGTPESIVFLDTTAIFDKVADVAYTVYFTGYSRDTSLSTNVENDWLKWAGDLVEAEVLLKMAVRLQNPALAKEAKEEIVSAKDRLWRMHEARRNAGAERSE